MTTDTGPLFRYARIGFSFEVHPNRVEIKHGSALALFGGGKRESILARNITDVESVSGLTRKLKITTADGKTKEYVLGAKNDEAREAILSIL